MALTQERLLCVEALFQNVTVENLLLPGKTMICAVGAAIRSLSVSKGA
ncbi:hypothetical protein U14_02846 [Candidatus Moduliflexus flocculans]|uniref:Uncharacterized protein n=1 Tax=Candidatus Moduliflexus flocculans TaxID=1499966 RepID=A0A081BMI5_9BACT|nr:hypothetical protein U14_02846 [Candidatus Moduliflexus flocculans]